MEYSEKNVERIANASFTLLYNALAKGKDPIEVFPAVEKVINEINVFSGQEMEIHPNLIRYSDASREVRPGGVIRDALLEMFTGDHETDGLISVISCGLIYYAKIGLDFEETIKEYTDYENKLLVRTIRNALIDLRDNRRS